MGEARREVTFVDGVYEKEVVAFGVVLVGFQHDIVEIEEKIGLVLGKIKKRVS